MSKLSCVVDIVEYLASEPDRWHHLANVRRQVGRGLLGSFNAAISALLAAGLVERRTIEDPEHGTSEALRSKLLWREDHEAMVQALERDTATLGVHVEQQASRGRIPRATALRTDPNVAETSELTEARLVDAILSAKPSARAPQRMRPAPAELDVESAFASSSDSAAPP